jgi:hypothetical protein
VVVVAGVNKNKTIRKPSRHASSPIVVLFGANRLDNRRRIAKFTAVIDELWYVGVIVILGQKIFTVS